MDTTHLILILQAIPGVGDQTIGHALDEVARQRVDVAELLASTTCDAMASLGLNEMARQFFAEHRERLLAEAAEDARWLRRCGASILTPVDVTYPARFIANLEKPPSVLFAYGQIGLLDQSTVAIACSNKSPEESLEAAERCALEYMQNGAVMVSGHNRIEYQRPALAAKRHDLPVCYVLDRGLLDAFGGDLTRELFPAARIWSPAYDPAVDLTLSPFPLRKPYVPTSNQRRDELVFALADRIIGGCIRAGGQMEKQCLAALKRGCEVLLAHEDAGTPKLLEHGARLFNG